MENTILQVKAHYEAFPFPPLTQLAQQLPGCFNMGVLNFLLRRRKHEWLPPDASIWVAGCGTQQALMWALSNPQTEILATDIAERSLEMSNDIAERIGLKNITFQQHDITRSTFRQCFDLVVCTGVLHHIPDPMTGLRKIRNAIKPSGAVSLMVYSTILREPFARFRKTLSLFLQGESDMDRRYEKACWLLEKAITSEYFSPPGREALDLIWHHRHERALLADALLNPQESTYDIDGLLSLLKGAGLSHSSWLYPSQWDMETYTESTSMIGQVQALDEISRWKAVSYLTGQNGPLMELLVEPEEVSPRPPYSLDELVDMRVVFSQGLRIYELEDGRVVRSHIVPPYTKKNGTLVGRERGAYGIRRNWNLPESAKSILQSCDGDNTFGAIIDTNAAPADRRHLIETLAEFFPPGLGLLAPC